jgi:hypothetical protein
MCLGSLGSLSGLAFSTLLLGSLSGLAFSTFLLGSLSGLAFSTLLLTFLGSLSAPYFQWYISKFCKKGAQGGSFPGMEMGKVPVYLLGQGPLSRGALGGSCPAVGIRGGKSLYYLLCTRCNFTVAVVARMCPYLETCSFTVAVPTWKLAALQRQPSH